MEIPSDFLADLAHVWAVLFGWPLALCCGALIASSLADALLTIARIVSAGRRKTREVTYKPDGD